MKKVIHKSESRGHANHGWLDSWHSFSFANYYNPERMHFGVLRVLNDDSVAAGMGFGAHPHDNMEIISIPLSGDLQHKDNMGNEQIIKEGDVQVMSAGTGIVHSEMNKNKDQEVKFLQIWVFPNKKDVTPRYDQLSFDKSERINKWQQVLSPDKNDEGVWIHQDAWFNLSSLEAGKELSYDIKKTGNGVYLFLLEGSIEIEGEKLNKRDAIGIWETESLNIKASDNSEILLMDVPMNLE
ncbi:pirin family protein [Marinigracilibium pacificum]|uniref:Pirin family protein n=1 Tax=Marinigracilibium pacificum TaxID=2729599 RepID=A0A848JBN3_9BACT|nr:pirin family protein [Marinigracilibium pacificum]NMM50412.1 pirin family protein [Marinigracilibium pacificum]